MRETSPNRLLRYSRLPVFTGVLFILIIYIGAVSADSAPIFPGLSEWSESDVRESAIAFVSTSTTPGLSGATLTVDTDDRDSEQLRSSLGFSAEFTIKKHIFNGYWGLAIVGGSLDDKISATSDSGEVVNVDLTRNVLGISGSLGLSLPINEHFKIRPYLSLGASDMHTESNIQGLMLPDPAGNPTDTTTIKTSAYIASATGSIDAIYWRWFGDNRLELAAEYDLIYTDSLSEDNPVLTTNAWNQTALIKGRYSGVSGLNTAGRPWRWQLYASHVNFLTFDKKSLGYTGLFEVGTGLEWQMNIKPLNWFGWQSVGITLGVITSRNVEGYNLGLTAQ